MKDSLYVYVTAELKRLVKQKAAAEGKTVTAVVETLLWQWVRDGQGEGKARLFFSADSRSLTHIIDISVLTDDQLERLITGGDPANALLDELTQGAKDE